MFYKHKYTYNFITVDSRAILTRKVLDDQGKISAITNSNRSRFWCQQLADTATERKPRSRPKRLPKAKPASLDIT